MATPTTRAPLREALTLHVKNNAHLSHLAESPAAIRDLRTPGFCVSVSVIHALAEMLDINFDVDILQQADRGHADTQHFPELEERSGSRPVVHLTFLAPLNHFVALISGTAILSSCASFSGTRLKATIGSNELRDTDPQFAGINLLNQAARGAHNQVEVTKHGEPEIDDEHR